MKAIAKLSVRLKLLSRVSLTRLACVLALIGLAFMVYSIFSPRPLPVILAMSVGQMFGMAAVACYLVAILVDLARRPSPDAEPPSIRPRDSRG
jgi:hypothetical protein